MTEAVQMFGKNKSNLLTRSEAAEYLGVSAQTLAVWACTNRYGLPLVKIGRLVKYRLEDLNRFIDNGIRAN